jgi:L-ascorbate metabolism protein UlaG (beta-lactamase superfamily)
MKLTWHGHSAFRIEAGRGQDFDRSVSVRQPVQGQRMERLSYRQELETGR